MMESGHNIIMTSCMDIGRLGFWLIPNFWYWNFDDLFPNNKEKLVEFTLENKKYPIIFCWKKQTKFVVGGIKPLQQVDDTIE